LGSALNAVISPFSGRRERIGLADFDPDGGKD
jgi:hypothetical protein